MVDIGQFLNGELEAKWYNIPGSSKARVQIRLLKPKRTRELTRICTQKGTRSGRARPYFDEDRYMDLLLDEAVVSWEAIEKDGEPLPVTRENKLLVDGVWPAFNTLWMTVLGVQSRVDEAYEEALQKNSPSGDDSTSLPT